MAEEESTSEETNSSELRFGSDSNSTFNDTTSETGRDENLAKIEIATLSLILIFAIFGNSLMLVALRKVLQFRPMSRMYFFMLNLSIADLFVAFGNILPQLAWDITFRFQGPDILCRMVKFLQVFVLYLSTYVLTSMAVDRYLVVCHSNFSRNYYGGLRGPKILVILSYVLSFILASPQAFIFSIKNVKDSQGKMIEDCWVTFIEPWGDKAYVTFFVVCAFGLPFLIIGFSYGAICYTVVGYQLPKDSKPRKLRSNGKPSMSSVSDTQNRSEMESSDLTQDIPHQNVSTQKGALQRQISHAKMKTLKLTLVVVICFFVCWAPFCITHLVMVYKPHNIGAIQVILLLLAALNSCTNPWIYLAFSESLCNQLRVFLKMGLKRGSDEESIGDEANMKDRHANRPPKQDQFDLPKINLIRNHASVGRNIASDQCDQKPETKSDIF